MIWAINGAALGSGVAMAASSDILIASDKASLGLPEVDVGLLGSMPPRDAPFQPLPAASDDVDRRACQGLSSIASASSRKCARRLRT